MAEATDAVSPPADPAVATTLSLLDEVFDGYSPIDFAVRLWEGTEWGPDPGQRTEGTLVLRHPDTLRKMLVRPTERNLAECYLRDDLDFEGDVSLAMPIRQWLLDRPRSLWSRLHLAVQLLRLPSGHTGHADGEGNKTRSPAKLGGGQHSLGRDRAAVTYHYDVSNDFYALWLDRRMVYSCALFASDDEDLDPAQERKLDYVCRKLRLQPGEQLLDIGCGWGGLIIHAAQHYGIEALGITLSAPQAELANERIRQAGLANRCRAEVVDYRCLDRPGQFNKLVSVGMVEHVGEDHLREYFSTAWALLKPGGVFLNHGIADLPGRPPRDDGSFITTYIFPDGVLPPIPLVFKTAEQAGFEARDLESLREHYALTLRRWVSRLEAHHDEAVAEVGEQTYRTWRLYMAGSSHWFAHGNIGVYQALFVKPDRGRSGQPLSRADWYDAAPT